MKRLLAVVLSAVLTLSLMSCKDENGTLNKDKDSVLENQSADNTSPVDFNAPIEGEITVAAYETFMYKEFLETSAKLFEEKYPGTKIYVESVSNMPEEKTMETEEGSISIISLEKDEGATEDYINKTNTALMSGGGADILAMDILPYYKLAENGSLENIDNYMKYDPDFNMNDYQQNIFDALKYKNGLYMMPINYYFEYFAYDNTLLSDEAKALLSKKKGFTIQELFQIAEKDFAENEGNDNISMIGLTDYSLFDLLFKSNYKSFVDVAEKKANFTDGRFEELLEAIKEYKEKGYIEADRQINSIDDVNLEDFSAARNQRRVYKAKHSFELLMNEITENDQVFRMSASDLGIEEDDVSLGYLTGDNGEYCFNYNLAFGINSNSQNKALAWAFIKFLSGPETSSASMLSASSINVNKNAFLESSKLTLQGMLFQMTGEEGFSEDAAGELTEEQNASLENYMKNVSEFNQNLNFFPLQDEIIASAIQKEVSSYFSGEKTAQETANNIQNKIELYLNE